MAVTDGKAKIVRRVMVNSARKDKKKGRGLEFRDRLHLKL